MATDKARTPAFGELTSKDGWLLDATRAAKAKREGGGKVESEADGTPVAPGVLALFSEPQTFRGLLWKPGGQPMVKSDEIEIGDEKLKVGGFGGYCYKDGIRCTKDKIVLVTGETPRSRLLGVGQVFLGLMIGGLLLALAIYGGRRPSEARL